MKKFSIMFFLVLVVALVACKQEEPGNGGAGAGDQPQADGSGGKELTPEQIAAAKKEKDAAEAEKLAREKALTALKDELTKYKKTMADAKKAFDAKTGKNEVTVPSGLTGVTAADKEKIQSSLGYNDDTHKELNDTITALNLTSGGKDAEKKTVSDVLKMLVDLDDATKKILDEHLKAENLAKIENDKTKIEKADKELKAFIASRDAFIASAQKTIKAAEAAKATAANAKRELDKIADKTKNTAKADETGYYHVTVKAIEKNATALEDLVK
ncbi:hypothetical protein [Borrelia sp. P9F1]|uniref:hypothetical protein n=1 Tax=Borrelia sp. P9F1 TaxID=3058374 RepID=UPI0026489937|nr:hypothetical protein [Borrelia sp. P9F1]WKC58680.1 hypothetical protein QYZ68_05610 [Borrelia sp. P9F1]